MDRALPCASISRMRYRSAKISVAGIHLLGKLGYVNACHAY